MQPAQRYRATYAFAPVDHLVRQEFYIWAEAIEKWKEQGLPPDYNETNLFQFDPPATTTPGLNLGWCEPPFMPGYEEKVIRVEGNTEIIQDSAGRWLRVFQGRRHGFMPDYLKHPVASRRDWEEEVSPRLDPDTPGRYERLQERCAEVQRLREADGRFITQGMVGGYMYLRALMGPEDVLYAFHDMPDLIHTMMERWTELMDRGLAAIQSELELDQIAIGEDICYKTGPLISPDMIREFLLPYYQHVVFRARARQSGTAGWHGGPPLQGLTTNRHLYFYVDTDGYAPSVLPLYLEAGMDVMMPFEVASGCDVVEVGRQYPDLVLAGGIDKRVLASGKEAIDAHLRHILPPMVERGGYIPMCDHGVPDNVSLENYLHYRRRMCEWDH
jgi:uroporphyrinogen decarboxylase